MGSGCICGGRSITKEKFWTFWSRSAANKHAAPKLLSRLLKTTGVHPETIVTDKLASYRAALNSLRLQGRHRPDEMRENNRAENSHLMIRRRERKQQGFKSQVSAQRYLSSYGSIYNAFNLQPRLIPRPNLRALRGHAEAAWAAATQET